MGKTRNVQNTSWIKNHIDKTCHGQNISLTKHAIWQNISWAKHATYKTHHG